MTIDEVLKRLSAVTGAPTHLSGNGSSNTKCPAHEDRNASLSVSLGRDDRILVKCHAGCTYRQILDAADLEPGDLFATKGSGSQRRSPKSEKRSKRQEHRPRPRIESVYPYRDAQRNLLFEVVRYEPKAFRQRRPDGNGGHVWNLEGVERVLYRLPEVLAAVESGTPIYVCEGERDVASVVKAGAVATCNSGGAGKWLVSYAETLRGAARVNVVADRDEAGRRHARAVAESLRGLVDEVVVLEPVEGKDVSDHLAAGHTLEQLRPPLTATTPQGSPAAGAAPRSEARRKRSSELVALSSITPERIDYLVPGVPRAMLTLLVGDPGLGKSLRSVELAGQVSRDGRGVILLTNEDHYAAVVRPRLEAVNADLDRVFKVNMRGEDGDEDGLWLPDDAPELADRIRECDADLFIIDPFTSFLPKNVDSFKDQSVRSALRPLKEIAESTGATGLLLAHLNKGLAGNALHRVGGSIGFPAAVRSAWLMARDPDDPGGEAGSRRVCAHIKSNVGAEQQSEVWIVRPTLLPAHDGVPELETARIERHGVSPHSGSSLLVSQSPEERSALVEAKEFLEGELRGRGWVKVKTVEAAAKIAGIKDRTLTRARTALGVVPHKEGFGADGVWFWELPAKDANLESPAETSGLGSLSANQHGCAESGGVDTPPNVLRLPSQRLAPLGDPERPEPLGGADARTAVDRVRELATQTADLLAPKGYADIGLDGWAALVEACNADAKLGGERAQLAVAMMESALAAAMNGGAS